MDNCLVELDSHPQSRLSLCITFPTWAQMPRAFRSSCASRQPRYLDTLTFQHVSMDCELASECQCCTGCQILLHLLLHSNLAFLSVVMPWVPGIYLHTAQCSHSGKYLSDVIFTLSSGWRSRKWCQSIHPLPNFPAHPWTRQTNLPPVLGSTMLDLALP